MPPRKKTPPKRRTAARPTRRAAPQAKPKVFERTPKPSSSAVGSGEFAIVGAPAARLDQTKTTQTPGPLPFSGRQGGDSVVTPQRLYFHKLTRFNPIRQLKPETLTHYFDLFQQGYLRYFALMGDAIEHRDPLLMSVIGKRKASMKRLRWEVVKKPGLVGSRASMADEQQEALTDFYERLEATSAVDLNVRGGMPMLLDFAMNSVGHKYATFEVVWRPSPDGRLTARFNFIPLWFFENRTGTLKFLQQDYSLDGVGLREGSWVTFTGPGLMEPCAVAYMLKHLCIRDALMYCEKCAMPGVIGKTDSPYGSDYYEALKQAVRDVSTDFSAIVGKEDELDTIDFSRSGELPYMPMIDYLDRVMSAIWRGADLSTISAKSGGSSGGQGASLQGKEEYYIQCSDAQGLSEVLNIQVDPLVLQWHFGDDVEQLVYFKLVVPPNIDAQTDISIVNALLSWGCQEIGQEQMMEHFGFARMIESDEACVTPQETTMSTQQKYMPDEVPTGAANEQQEFHRSLGVLVANAVRTRDVSRLLRVGMGELAHETAQALRPLRDAMQGVLDAANETRLGAFQALRARIPGIVEEINKDPVNAGALSRTMAASWFNGLFAAKKEAEA